MIADQDFATADPVGGTDDAFFFHHLDDPCGPVIADLEMSLDKAGRSFAFAGDQGYGLVIVLVVLRCRALPPASPKIGSPVSSVIDSR